MQARHAALGPRLKNRQIYHRDVAIVGEAVEAVDTSSVDNHVAADGDGTAVP
jgi:hypothetical protein